MKCEIVLLIAVMALVAADDEWKPVQEGEQSKGIHDECLKESGLTSEQLQKLEAYEFPDEKEVRDHILCCAKKAGLFTEDKGYDRGRVLAQFVSKNALTDKAQAAVAECLKDSAENITPPEWAYRDFICILEKKGELNMKIVWEKIER